MSFYTYAKYSQYPIEFGFDFLNLSLNILSFCMSKAIDTLDPPTYCKHINEFEFLHFYNNSFRYC